MRATKRLCTGPQHIRGELWFFHNSPPALDDANHEARPICNLRVQRDFRGIHCCCSLAINLRFRKSQVQTQFTTRWANKLADVLPQSDACLVLR